MRFACINYLEAVVAKVPDAMRYLSEATGPAAAFEEQPRKTRASRLRRRPFARLGSAVESARDRFAKRGNGPTQNSLPSESGMTTWSRTPVATSPRGRLF
jgi:hypothetical protein